MLSLNAVLEIAPCCRLDLMNEHEDKNQEKMQATQKVRNSFFSLFHKYNSPPCQ